MSADDPRLLSAFCNAPMGVVVTRPDGVVVACNAAMGRLLDRDPATLRGSVLFDAVHPDDRADAVARVLVPPGATRLLQHECRLRLGAGRVVWVSVSAVRVAESPGCAEHMVIHVEDATERKQREALLSHQALHDPLTGLANRVLLAERIRGSLSGRGRHARPSHLFYLDLNGFKAVNDHFGHAAGDVVLTELAQRIVAVLREGDTAARLGGDEFAVLCEDIEPQQAASIAHRLEAVAAEPFLVGGTEVVLSAAVGSCPARVADPAVLLREADRRMYEAKRGTSGEH